MNSIKTMITLIFFVSVLLCLQTFVGPLISKSIQYEGQSDLQRKPAFYQPRDFYDSVYEICFPRKYCEEDRYMCIWMMLRFIPNNLPESQIVIRHDGKGQTSIDYMMATVSANRVLNDKFNNIRNPDITKVAELMDVRLKYLTIDNDTFFRWYDAFLRELKNSAEHLHSEAFAKLMPVDATRYVLEYQQMENYISFSFPGPEIDYNGPNDQHDSPLVKWMISIRKEIEKLSK